MSKRQKTSHETISYQETSKMAPSANGTNGSAHSWTSLPNAMQPAVKNLQATLSHDKQWQAYIETDAIIETTTFGVQSAGSEEAILVAVHKGGKTSTTTGNPKQAEFVLVAEPQQWEKFFEKSPQSPFTSFVGLQVSSIIASDRLWRLCWSNTLIIVFTGYEHQTRGRWHCWRPCQICTVLPLHYSSARASPRWPARADGGRRTARAD